MAAGALDDLSLLREYAARRGRFFGEVADHLFLVGVSVGSAVAVGVPLGFLARSRRAWERPLFFVLNLAQTIPSLALFGLLIGPLALLSRHWELARELGVRGIGWAPAVIALGLYALLPIARNTYTSLKTLDPGVLEAGRGMGMGRGQLLWRVELPLALPVILAGVRTAAVQNIGNTAVAALIGAGGLGVFIFQGLGQAAVDLILLGAVPTILIAVAADFAFQGVIGLARPGGAP
jgi:osmoprotectant transport system permease protein